MGVKQGVSIHAPAWGATAKLHEETGRGLVSIHAPAWGATKDFQNFMKRLRFQSTRPRGARRTAQEEKTLAQLFQSTRPRGARPIPPMASPILEKFQSTRPRGARPHNGSRKGRVFPVSIHAPAWGATLRCADSSTRNSSFNPRARVGRDGVSHHEHARLCQFQSTRPRGARQGHNHQLR